MVLAALGLTGAPGLAPATGTPGAFTPPAIALKSCGAGYTHAVIGGEEKCLRRGQFCSKRYKSQYRKDGFRCVNGRLQ